MKEIQLGDEEWVLLEGTCSPMGRALHLILMGRDIIMEKAGSQFVAEHPWKMAMKGAGTMWCFHGRLSFLPGTFTLLWVLRLAFISLVGALRSHRAKLQRE